MSNLREYPLGSIAHGEVLKTGTLLILVRNSGREPEKSVVRYENREGGRCRSPGGWSFWIHLTRMCGPWAIFRVDMGACGSTSIAAHPESNAYLNQLRLREAASLRARADVLESLVKESELLQRAPS